MVFMWRSGHGLSMLILFIHSMGTRNETQSLLVASAFAFHLLHHLTSSNLLPTLSVCISIQKVKRQLAKSLFSNVQEVG